MTEPVRTLQYTPILPRCHDAVTNGASELMRDRADRADRTMDPVWWRSTWFAIQYILPQGRRELRR